VLLSWSASLTTAPGTSLGSSPILGPAVGAPHGSPSPTLLPGVHGAPVRAANDCIDVPILYYHYIRVNPRPWDHLGFELSVTPADFAEQMDWLRIAGGHPITFAQVVAALDGGPPLPPHPVVLSFDDGHNDFATTAVPILLRNHFVATSFVIAGFLGRPSYMTTQQVQAVARDGMVIGAHTMHHVDLDPLPAQLADIEIATSRAILQRLTGQAVLDFAYPYGDYDPAVMQLVREAGFRDAAATTGGSVQCTSNLYALHRDEVLGDDTVAQFAALARVAAPPRGWEDPYLPAAARAQATPDQSPWEDHAGR
jgi:peptidoglycan/xylan/chitin deacetylase (PgdA/CDA1 family)